MDIIVTHKVTVARGRVTVTAERLSPYDGDVGPWMFVEFFDGLRCWVPESELIIETQGAMN